MTYYPDDVTERLFGKGCKPWQLRDGVRDELGFGLKLLRSFVFASKPFRGFGSGPPSI